MTTLLAWWDGDAEGVVNMAADEALAAAAEQTGRPLIRFYGWPSPTLSLGAFQKLEEARGIADVADAALVRRPSGGGAIVHGSDLTYALAVPKSHPLGAAAPLLYTAAHTALAAALEPSGIDARLYAGQPRDGDFFCFSRRAGGDLVATLPGRGPSPTDPKILGSAQRRLAGAVVQHGSLLLRENPRVGPAARHPGVEDLQPAFAAVDLRRLAEAWLARLAAALGGDWEWHAGTFHTTAAIDGRSLPTTAADIAARAAAHADPRWLGRR